MNQTWNGKQQTTRTLDNAVCVCGHWYDDHRCSGYDLKTGRIDLAECRDQTCQCSTYRRDVLLGQRS